MKVQLNALWLTGAVYVAHAPGDEIYCTRHKISTMPPPLLRRRRRPSWKGAMALILRIAISGAAMGLIAVTLWDAKLTLPQLLLKQSSLLELPTQLTLQPTLRSNQSHVVHSIPIKPSPESISDVSKQELSQKDETPQHVQPQQPSSVITTNDNTETVDPCEGYQGVLLIDRGDDGAAATTLLFLYVINFLIYADMYQLLPWVHLNNFSHRVYDHTVHGDHVQPPQQVEMLSGMITKSENIGITSCSKKQLVGPVIGRRPRPFNYTVNGTGVWNSYFEPISAFSPTHQCHKPKPLLVFNLKELTALHYRWPYAVRSWYYIDCAQPSPGKNGYFQWYGNMRRRGHEKVAKYFKPLPWLMEKVELANPTTNCLAMHARFTDKSGNRAIVSLADYLPYAQAFVDLHPKDSDAVIYLATDSSETLRNISISWPAHVAARVKTQPSVLRSSNETAVFDLGASSHHRTNTEVLVDVYAMAKCTAFLHGRSAVSEAVFYVNVNLHNRSVDLEDPRKPTVKQFKAMLGGEEAAVK